MFLNCILKLFSLNCIFRICAKWIRELLHFKNVTEGGTYERYRGELRILESHWLRGLFETFVLFLEEQKRWCL